MYWMISANSKIYDHAHSFEHYGYIDWRQGRTKYNVGDTVYIYCTKPIQKIRYQCRVEQIDMESNEIRDDEEYWLDKNEYKNSVSGKFIRLKLIKQIDVNLLSLGFLQSNGLKAAPQGPLKVTKTVLAYLEKIFAYNEEDDFFPERINSSIEVYEGAKKQITVNKYERSSIARAMCIEFHKCKCVVCDFDFEKTYGKIGEKFIHVHHIKPIHTIGYEYKIDYIKDLIPVCPNCHAMLHRRINGKEVTLSELQSCLRQRKNNY